MKIAYLVQAHTNFKQVNMLIKKVVDEHTDVYIHIDKKNDQLFHDLVEAYKNSERVFVITKRVDVNWSGFSQIQATLNLMQFVDGIKKKYDYVSLISGQCFPIKSNEEIRSFLIENNGSEFIAYRDITNDKVSLYRLKNYNFFRENKNIRKFYMRTLDNVIRRVQKNFVMRKNFKGMNLYHGSQWFTITYACMQYILTYLKENKVFLEDFKYTLVPDEHFFQMILLNTNYKEKVVNNNLRYIDWENCKNSPRTLSDIDFDKLMKSSKLIARKFDSKIDEEILIQLTEVT